MNQEGLDNLHQNRLRIRGLHPTGLESLGVGPKEFSSLSSLLEARDLWTTLAKKAHVTRRARELPLTGDCFHRSFTGPHSFEGVCTWGLKAPLSQASTSASSWLDLVPLSLLLLNLLKGESRDTSRNRELYSSERTFRDSGKHQSTFMVCIFLGII